ncbi:FtsX-like permease family protein [Actinoallomurus rhizosphaericola]|uniref:FtsX-like permease family protein n=1 Tax=Actinoallomurus rhizosphaericola TaxID=2952536 RepID=UPI002092A1E1|nr:FtsX-like permease family protein [Actinoallomurus rhizosphaericola]MCO5998443.1 hypothetical protein [Actinoallomurus rhizosphaericola]
MIGRTARAHWPALLVLGLLVLATTFLADAGPRALVAGYDRAAGETVAGAPSGAADLVVSSGLPSVAPSDEQARGGRLLASTDGLATAARRWRATFPQPLRDTVVTADQFAGSSFLPLAHGVRQTLALGYSSSVNAHIRYVSGRPPGPTLETALPERAARRLGVAAGDVLRTATQPALNVRITGLFVPADPASAYWASHAKLADAEQGNDIIRATGILDPAGYRALCTRTPFGINATWTYTPGTDRVTARSAKTLVDDVHRSAEKIAGEDTSMSTRLDWVLDDFVQRLRTTQALMFLSVSGLFAAALGVLALAVGLLLRRMNPDLHLQAARGASRLRLAGLTAGVTALVTLPAAAVGLALSALLVDGPAQTVSYAAVAILVVTAIGGPAAAGLRLPGRRLVAEGLLVVLAVAGTYLVRRRGLPATGSVDPFLSAVPVLLAVAAGLVLLRALPYVLRPVQRILARGRSAVPFIGVARVSTAALPLVVVLLAVAVIGFGSTVEASLSRAQRLATYASVGGDARVDAVTMSRDVIDRVRRTPGVRAVVPAQTVHAARMSVDGQLISELTVIGVDLPAYRRLMADTPLRPPVWPRGPGIPALFSPTAHAPKSGVSVSTDYGQSIPLRNAGTVTGFPGQSGDDPFVLVPADALSRATGGGNTGSVSIFVRGDHIDAAALSRAAAQPSLGAAEKNAVTTYRQEHAALTQGTLGRIVGQGFGLTAALVTCYGTLAILVMLFAGARGRGRAVSYLRTLGLSRRQAHWLAVVEIAPVLLVAFAGGWALGLVLPRLLGPAIDLSPYTGGSPVRHFVPDLAVSASLAGGLLVFAALAVFIDALVATRRGLGGVLRIGEV